MRGLGTRFFGGSRVPVNRRDRGSSATIAVPPPPIWYGTPSFSLTVGIPATFSLPVSVADGSSISLTWIAPGSQPAWVQLNNGISPSITFTGGQATGDTTASLVIRATANSQNANSPTGNITVSAAPAVGLSFVFSSNEGYATTDGTSSGSRPRLVRGPMAYEGAHVTRDGTIIEAFDGAHTDTDQSNRVGEFSPSTGALTEVYPTSGPNTGIYGYDNLIYWYDEAIDCLVAPSRGVYSRAYNNNPSGGAAWIYLGNGQTASPGGRPPVHTTSTSTNALIYVPSADQAGYEEQIGWFNVHAAYSRTRNIAVIIGGASGGGPVANKRLTIYVPSKLVNGSIVSRYYAIHRQFSVAGQQVSGANWCLHKGRSACCFLNDYVYWCGGVDNTSGNPDVNYLFRASILPFVGGDINGAWTVEKLANAPVAFAGGAMTADPFSNTLTLITYLGTYVYDVSANSWTTVTSSDMPEYFSTFQASGEGPPFIYWPHAGYVNEVNGSYFNSDGVMVYRAGTLKRKSYWWGGSYNEQSTSAPNYVARYDKVRSLKVTRGQQAPVARTLEMEDPTAPASLLGSGEIGPLGSCKHIMLLDNQSGKTTYDGTQRKLFLFSGDWTYGWPTSQRSDYPPSSYWSDDGRQEMWYADISDTTLSGTSTVRLKLAQNYYHNYPWSGSHGYSGDGGFGGVEPQRGPFMPDAVGFAVDKRGDFWCGPTSIGYSQQRTSDVGGECIENTPSYNEKWSPVYKWGMPGLHPVTGVRLGNGWTRPNQTRMKNPMRGGVKGVDFDVGENTDGQSLGVGRPNQVAYDPNTDALYCVGVQSDATNIYVHLYKFPCVPTAGTHTWTDSGVLTISLKSIGLSNATGAHNDSTDQHNGTISNTVYCNGKVYFTFVPWYFPVSSGGNRTATTRCISWIFSIRLSDNLLEWLPYPDSMPFFSAGMDGPLSQDCYDAGWKPGTPAEYRPLKAVGNKLVLGPERMHRVSVDPWICIYDTDTRSWNTYLPPSEYSITNGGHDFPNTKFGMAAIPSLGEVWLAGQMPLTEYTGTYGTWIDSRGIHNPEAYYRSSGLHSGRRIIRLKV